MLEQHRQQEPQEIQRQQQQESRQLEELLEPPPRSPPQPVPPSPQRPETGEEGLPVYGPPTPAWLRPGGPASIPAEPGREDGVVAIACAMRTPADPQSEIKGSLYGMDGLAPRFLRDRRRGRNPSPRKGMRPALPVVVRPMRPGHGARLMTTGGSLLSSTYSCATKVRSRPFRS